jgi:hypothetical protein
MSPSHAQPDQLQLASGTTSLHPSLLTLLEAQCRYPSIHPSLHSIPAYLLACNLVDTLAVGVLQSQVGMKHGARGKRQTLKSQSTDLGTTDVGKTTDTDVFITVDVVYLQYILYFQDPDDLDSRCVPTIQYT